MKIPDKVKAKVAERTELIRLSRKKVAAQRRLNEGKKKRISEMSPRMRSNMKVAPIK